jgi:hypothetical protein
MTELRVIGYRMLVLHFDELSCAIIASELVAIDHDGAGARLAIDGPLRDLAEYLPQCSSSAPPMRLIVDVAGTRRAFRARARLELVETSLLYRMPRMLRDCGCAPWLRGIALLDNESHDGSDVDQKRPALWLDLARLADACEGSPMNPKEMV